MEAHVAAGRETGVLVSIKRLFSTLVSLVHGRLELVATELEEEATRLVGILVGAIAALLCGTIGLGFVAVGLLLAAPAERRALVAAILALAFLGAAAFAALYVRRLQRLKPRPFDATLTELERDREHLRGAS